MLGLVVNCLIGCYEVHTKKMINRKQTKTMSLAIVGMALLATVISISSPTQALALGHWNLDEDFVPSSGLSEDGMDSSGTTDNSNEEDEDSATATTTDDDEGEGSGESSSDSTSEEEDSTHAAYHNLQACLSDIEGERSPTEQEVQDCMESSYREMDSSDSTPDKTTDDVDEGEDDEEGEE
jgi:hypothetical protein